MRPIDGYIIKFVAMMPNILMIFVLYIPILYLLNCGLTIGSVGIGVLINLFGWSLIFIWYNIVDILILLCKIILNN